MGIISRESDLEPVFEIRSDRNSDPDLVFQNIVGSENPVFKNLVGSGFGLNVKV